MEYKRLTFRYESVDGTKQVGYSEKLIPCFNKQAMILNRLAELEDKIENGTLVELPCKVGDTVYKICPKCNDKHNGSCENCAWRGCISYCGCDVFGLWGDGKYPPERCTIVPYTMNWRFIPVVLKHIGTKVFLTCEEAKKRLEELKKNG